MTIACPACRVPLAAEDVPLDTGLAKCRTCNLVFRLDDTPELATPAVRQRQNVGRPLGVVSEETGDGLTMQYRWFSPKYIFLAIWCLFWDGFLVLWFVGALNVGDTSGPAFPLLCAAAGLFVTYVAIA